VTSISAAPDTVARVLPGPVPIYDVDLRRCLIGCAFNASARHVMSLAWRDVGASRITGNQNKNRRES
jgi:hypothetical protein